MLTRVQLFEKIRRDRRLEPDVSQRELSRRYNVHRRTVRAAGLKVRYTTAANLVNELAEAQDERQLTKVIARYGRCDLLCLDEFGYLELDKTGAKLLFQIFTDREERRAMAVASNAPFSEWKRTFTDPRLCAAIVDRLTYNAHIIETGTQSFRLAQTRARAESS
jgi:DNA replication protein DnaC